MKRSAADISAFVTGIIFGAGLALSGMTQPQKIIGFLNVLGSWDPSLLFVMAGAIPVHFISYRLIKGRQSPLFDVKWHLPQDTTSIGTKLLGGSFLFGIGWGLGGYCPGPALESVAAGQWSAVVFVVMMTFGMLAARWMTRT